MSRDEQLKKLRTVFGPVVEDLDDGDPMKAAGVAVGERVTGLVSYLSLYFPNEDINRLMTQVWHLVGSATTPVTLGPVYTPSTVLSRRNGEVIMMILVPPNWAEIAVADHTMAVGAMIFCGSQAVDFYNGRLLDNPEECSARGRAYEVEALRIFRDTDPSWVPNSYQADMLAKYPEGLNTEGIVLYETKETPRVTPPVFMAEA